MGHGRSAVAFDVIRRFFLFKGYEVKYVSNFTDIDDKMIKRAAEEGISVKDLAEKIIPKYHSDYDALNVLRPDVQPLATEYVEQMININKKLEDKGFCYLLDDGLYFDVSKFSEYGKLSGNNLEDLQAGHRKEVTSGKRNHQDFVLWKFKKVGEPSWESPWGEGRPGWHIECSAMTMACLGLGFDIHGGGLDLTFPHHECEIAQTEGAYGANSFAKYWMHNGFITIDDVKMSKSLGNFFTLEDIFKKYDPVFVRFMFLQTHYRKPVNFSDVLLEQSKAALTRIFNFVDKLKSINDSAVEVSSEVQCNIDNMLKSFSKSMEEDFDTSGGLAAVFDLIKSINKKDINSVEAKAVLSALSEVDMVLAVIFYNNETEIPENILSIAKKRDLARSEKNYALSDKLRAEIENAGYKVEDSSEGTVVKTK